MNPAPAPAEMETLLALAVLTPAREAEYPPPPPRTPEETGMAFPFLVELALKTLLHAGMLRHWELARRLRLPVGVVEPLLDFIRTQRLCETVSGSAGDTQVSYQLTDAGHARACAALARNHYLGPTPVSLEDYVAQVERQSVRQVRVSREAMRRAFHGVVICPSLLDQLGAALNSGRAIFLYGPSGSGKTFIAEHLARLLEGSIYVPHAIGIDGEVIQVFDPLVHRPASDAVPGERLERTCDADERWMHCLRPVVMAGGELTLPMLDLQFDRRARFYTAPPQVKANNGIFVVDDLGRQLVAPRDLMNRWIVPLDRHIDHLALHTGKKFCLPFDVTVVLSTNLKPSDLGEEAFLRRLGYKIQVGPVDLDEYRRIFIQACERARVDYSEEIFRYLVREHHGAEDRPLLASIPYDVVAKVRDRADYLGTPAELTDEALDWAWRSQFAME